MSFCYSSNLNLIIETGTRARKCFRSMTSGRTSFVHLPARSLRRTKHATAIMSVCRPDCIQREVLPAWILRDTNPKGQTTSRHFCCSKLKQASMFLFFCHSISHNMKGNKKVFVGGTTPACQYGGQSRHHLLILSILHQSWGYLTSWRGEVREPIEKSLRVAQFAAPWIRDRAPVSFHLLFFVMMSFLFPCPSGWRNCYRCFDTTRTPPPSVQFISGTAHVNSLNRSWEASRSFWPG